MAQVSKFDGLIHAKDGRVYDPTDMHEVSHDLNDITDILVGDHPISDSRDDKFFEESYLRDVAAT